MIPDKKINGLCLSWRFGSLPNRPSPAVFRLISGSFGTSLRLSGSVDSRKQNPPVEKTANLWKGAVGAFHSLASTSYKTRVFAHSRGSRFARLKIAEQWKTLVNIPDFAALSGRENRRLGVGSILVPVLNWEGVWNVSRGTISVWEGFHRVFPLLFHVEHGPQHYNPNHRCHAVRETEKR
jgi:hypothetical protein